MNILVVVGACLKQNSSANLCHISYINGMLELGHSVDLISMKQDGFPVDESIVMPKVDNEYNYYGLSLYQKLSKSKKNAELSGLNREKGVVVNKGIKRTVKKYLSKLIIIPRKILWNCYGPYSITKPWCNRAAQYKSDKHYDYVISLSYPPVSNMVVKKLIDKNNIVYDKWIQIWEDPWSSDLYLNKKYAKKIEKEERKLVNYGDRIIYVSPLTLEYQKRKFPESADRMRWFPVPAYYDSSDITLDIVGEKRYGYFGDYSSKIRNLKPFYSVAVDKGIRLNICGNSDLKIENKSNVYVYPRLNLNELKPIENDTNVLVFVSNLYGGQIPGKIYQYAATNKIVLFILDGTKEEKQILKDYFESFNRFVFCENNEDSISAAIDRIENNDFGNVKNVPLDDFKASKTINKILESAKD